MLVNSLSPSLLILMNSILRNRPKQNRSVSKCYPFPAKFFGKIKTSLRRMRPPRINESERLDYCMEKVLKCNLAGDKKKLDYQLAVVTL